MIKGIILDFNGTLYLDHDLNYQAWKYAFDFVKNKKINYDDFNVDVENLTRDIDYSQAILKFFNLDLSFGRCRELSDLKENKYRELIVQQKRNKLINGAEKFLDFLKENSIPFCLASMAPTSNINFYLDYLNLKKWFTEKNLIYDDGNYFNKNQMYLEAISRMKIKKDETLLVEDSPKVILRSNDIGIKNIIYMNTKNKSLNYQYITKEIIDFEMFDYKILNK